MNLPGRGGEHFEEMIRPQSGRSQAVRYRLVATLLELNRQIVEGKLKNFPEGSLGAVELARALVRFRQGGRYECSAEGAGDARMPMGSCRIFAEEKELPPAPPPSFPQGSEDEAW